MSSTASTTTTASSTAPAKVKSFADLGVRQELCEQCEQLKWTKPTKIQQETLPFSLQKRDVIGLAETGSGKTGAFVLPILQRIIEERPRKPYAVILSPTRELCAQISEQVRALGAGIPDLRTATIIGGMNPVEQQVVLQRQPLIIVATPGRLLDHLKNTKGFHLNHLKFLVMDEADRLLNEDFEKDLNEILEVLNKNKEERQTMLFSATMTRKVQKLEKASLTNPARVEVSSKYSTVDTLIQQFLFVPAKHKDTYLVFLLNEMRGNSFIVFVHTCNNAQRLALILRSLGMKSVPLHGQMSQPKRLGALSKFKTESCDILIATDVASRGLDIPHVDCVINYDLPTNSKDYVHRVGRTARAGRSGRSITIVTQYDIELYQRIEQLIQKKLDPYPCEKEQVLQLFESVSEAQRYAANEMKEHEARHSGRKHSNHSDDDEDEKGTHQAVTSRMNKKLKSKPFHNKGNHHRK